MVEADGWIETCSAGLYSHVRHAFCSGLNAFDSSLIEHANLISGAE